MQNHPRENGPKRFPRSLWPRLYSSIRGKIITPYLLLTITVAVTGIYVVMTLVTGSLNERLDTHLVESGLAVLDGLARVDRDQLETATLLAHTSGVALALQDNDADAVKALMRPSATAQNVDVLIVINADGDPVVNWQREDGSLKSVDFEFDPKDVWIASELLEARDPSALPRRGLGDHPVAKRDYYYLAIPIGLESDMVGVLMIGTPLETLLASLKSLSLADVTVYLDGGQAVESTLVFGFPPEDRDTRLQEFAIAEGTYTQAIRTDIESTQAEDIKVDGRDYRLVRGPLLVGNQRLAAFAVLLPSDFIYDANTLNRATYVTIFTVATAFVILIGFVTAQRITDPLSQLVETSKAIAEGDLTRRSGVESTDETGTLAQAFDLMTERLSERTAALETSLKREQATASRMRSTLLSIGDGVIFEDTNGNFEPLNRAAESMLAEMSAHFLSGPMRELAVPDQELVDDERTNPWLLESRRFQVANRMYSVHSAGVTTDSGDNLGTVVVVRDVTAEVEAEQLKDAFVAHVSHELRTPLTAIKGYTGLLLTTAGSNLNESQYEFLNRIGRQTDNLVSMINALLDFSEVEASGRLGLRRKPLALSDLAKEVYQEWASKMAEKSLKFDLEIEDDLPLVNADIDRLRWAVINLVRNALQYTDEGGSVKLRLSSSYGRVVFDVVDTGAGIPIGEQRNLFTRFYRVMQDQDDVVRGLGLGLYVTKAIAEAHNGYVQVVSEVGSGSTFSLVLPAMRENELEPVPA